MKTLKITIQSFSLCIVFLFGCSSPIDEVYDLKEMGLKKQALEKLTEILKEDPANAEAYFAQANIQLEEGLISESMRSYEDALKIEPENTNFNFYSLMASALANKQNEKHYTDKLDKYIENFPDDFRGYILKARNYNGNNLDEYYNTILKINDLAKFSDWQKVYSDSTKKINASTFIVITDSAKYFDDKNNIVGYLKKNEEINIKEIKNDTIIYISQSEYNIVKALAWKVINGEFFLGMGKVSYFKILDYNSLYINPTVPDAYAGGYADIHGRPISYYSSPKVPDYLIENGQISYTGKKQKYSFNLRESYHLYFDWAEVSYNTRNYLIRKIPVGDNIILLKGSTALTIFKSEFNRGKNIKLLKNIMEANNVAMNMTVDLVNLKTNLDMEKLEFNKDNIQEYYKYKNYHFIFTDGLLTSIDP